MDRKKAIKLGIGILVSLFFVWLIIGNTDGASFFAAFRTANVGWIAAGVVLCCTGYLCRIQRWRIMLNTDGEHDVPLKTVAVPFLVSFAANNVLPFRAGDVMRVFAFSNWLGVGTVQVLATMVVERLLDLLCLLVVFGLALLLFDSSVGAAAGSMVGFGAGGILAIASAVLFVLLFPRMFKILALRLLSLILPSGSGLIARTTEFFDKLGQQASGTQMPKLLGLSALAWFFEGSVFYTAARSIPAFQEPLAALLAFPVATLATLLPSTPGYAGTFHYFAIWATEVMGNPVAEATAFAVIVHMMLWLTVTISGGFCAIIWISKTDPSQRRMLHPSQPVQLDETR
jgi:uncharacterized protein (TIRG00374 family)